MITLDRVSGVATVQAAPRRGFAWAGVPPGGPLVAGLLAAANRRVGNPPQTPGIELLGGLAWTCDTHVALDDALYPPGHHRAPPAGRLRYLAVAGGLVVPTCYGGQGTSWQAGLGAPLRAGDALPTGVLLGSPAAAHLPELTGPLRLLPGPDPDAFPADVLTLLTVLRWTVLPGADRVGARLTGFPVPVLGGDRPSSPMVRGAIQVLPSGDLVLLGPDHPTTGGYPVAAVVASDDHDRAGALLPGDVVRFRSG